MTVYVDDFRMQATVGQHTAVWSHLFSDQLDSEELHQFAERIGLRRRYFQQGVTLGGKPAPERAHYDVTEGMRRRAVSSGAIEVGFRQFAEIIATKRSIREGQHA